MFLLEEVAIIIHVMKEGGHLGIVVTLSTLT